MVSLGNTGGIFAAATFKVGRIAGVERGCIATVIPRQNNEFVLLDAGREHRMQAVAPRAIRRDGQRLFARSSAAAKIRASAF